MTRKARNELPDFKEQMDTAGKLDQVDPTVAKLITQSGLSDGNASDDKVSVSKGSWPAASLKPSQTSMVLGKALGMALFMLKSGKVGGDLGALVSKDGHILDGHHRWAATILASGSKGKVGGYGVNLPGKELLKVLNVVSKGLFNVRGGKAGKGALSEFTEGNVRSMLTDFTENGIGGAFPWSADDVKGVLETNFGSVEAGVDQIAKNAKMITTSAPGWSPDRKQMPVIEPEQVPSAAKALTKGEVDWNDPYRKEGRLRSQLVQMAMTLPEGSGDRRAVLRLAAGNMSRPQLIRLASTLPKGSPERKAILSGLVQASDLASKEASRGVTRNDRRYVASDDPRSVLVAWGGPDLTMDMGGWVDDDAEAFLEAVQDEARYGGGAELDNVEIQDARSGRRVLKASDRSSLIHLASTLPKGSEERRAILSGLKKG